MKQILRTVKKCDTDIHGIASDVKSVLNTLEKNSTPSTWKLVKQYHQNLTLDDVSNSTVRTTLRELNRIIPLMNGQNIAKLSKADVDDVLYQLRVKYPKGVKDDSYFNHVTTLKMFVRWVILEDRLYNVVGDPDITSHIKLTKPKSKIQQKHLITFVEYQKMIDTTSDVQERALLSISYECGTRTAELLTINREDVHFDELGARISINGKTGKRDIRVMRAARYLYVWYNTMPQNEGPLFIMTGKKYGNRMSVRHALRVIKRIASDVSITKRVTFQINRHSGATITSGMISESQMKQQFGWSRTSTMPSVYVHLSGTNVDNGYAKYYGVPSKSNDDLRLLQCSNCTMLYEPGDDICVKCGVEFKNNTLNNTII